MCGPLKSCKAIDIDWSQATDFIIIHKYQFWSIIWPGYDSGPEICLMACKPAHFSTQCIENYYSDIPHNCDFFTLKTWKWKSWIIIGMLNGFIYRVLFKALPLMCHKCLWKYKERIIQVQSFFIQSLYSWTKLTHEMKGI